MSETENVANNDTDLEVPETDSHEEVQETDWKALARKWEARAKAAKADTDAAARWREYEQSQKSEHEKLQERLDALQAEATQATARLMRYEVASEKGIPAEAIDLLTGSSRDELEAAADKLLALIANQSKTTTKPDLNQGKPTNAGVSTADQFASALAEIL
jgi:hypothetical protein